LRSGTEAQGADEATSASREATSASTVSEPATLAEEMAGPGGWAGIADVVVVLAVAAGAWVLSGNFAAGDISLAYGVAPELVPRAIILVIAGLALLLLLGELALPRGQLRLRLHPRIGPVLFCIAVLSVYAFSFERLGAFTLMPLFCVAVSRTFVRRPLWTLLIYGVAVSVVTWIVFVLLLRAPLPGSRLPFF
jgi:hypothetical protein